MRYIFRDKLEIDSEWKIIQRMASLSEIESVWYDCCVKSCMAFTGKYKDLDQCIHCPELRYDSEGKPRRRFGYLPLIPRLKGFFQSKQMPALMLYHHDHIHPKDGAISDIFDGEGY